ncbi:epidermal retinol dehydrogenase 2-like protein, partial [Dinothrombium tinctorium]
MSQIVSFLKYLLLTAISWIESIIIHLIPTKLLLRNINNELVLITGAGNGIGRQLAIKFAKEGCRIVLWDIDQKGLDETCKQIESLNKSCWKYVCDLTNRNEVYTTAKKVKDEIGTVTILVNNAGYATKSMFLEKRDEDIIKTFEVNVLAHFWTCKAFLPDMMSANKGHIVSIASLAGYLGTIGLTDYCSSKFAAVGFLESLKMELMAKGCENIVFTEVSPYFIDTRMFSGINSRIIPVLDPERVAERVVNAVRAKREFLYLPSPLWLLVAIK